VTSLLQRALRLTWWPICPSFAFVVLAFTRDRACFDRYHLLPGIDTQPALAWLVAAIYVIGHAWLIAAFVSVVLETGELLPRPRAAVAALGSTRWKVAAMVVVMAIEYAPADLWRLLARSAGLCG
jgi:hypothetical protein